MPQHECGHSYKNINNSPPLLFFYNPPPRPPPSTLLHSSAAHLLLWYATVILQRENEGKVRGNKRVLLDGDEDVAKLDVGTKGAAVCDYGGACWAVPEVQLDAAAPRSETPHIRLD